MPWIISRLGPEEGILLVKQERCDRILKFIYLFLYIYIYRLLVYILLESIGWDGYSMMRVCSFLVSFNLFQPLSFYPSILLIRTYIPRYLT